MRRAAFNILALASAVAFLAVLSMWVRGHFVGDVYHVTPGAVTGVTPRSLYYTSDQVWRRQWSIHSGPGHLQFVRRELQQERAGRAGWTTMPPDTALAHMAIMPGMSDVSRAAAGFSYFRREKQPFNTPSFYGWAWGFLVITVPYWALAAPTAVLPAAWVARRVKRLRQRARLARGHCPACAYDLRGTPDRCPECGYTPRP